MADEADVYEGVRAQFPLSFGKQSKSQTPLELVHNATRRTTTGASATSTAANDKPSASKKADAFPSLSSSSQDWISSFKNSNPRKSSRDGGVGTLVGPPRPPAGLDEEDEKMIGPPPGRGGSGDGDEEHLIGPPRPPPGKAEDDDGPTIGPPRPPPGNAEDDDDDDGPTIGPPRPPPGALDSDSDSDEDEDVDVDEEDEDPGYRVPLSNEIVLKGHTKVKYLADLFPWILLFFSMLYIVKFFTVQLAARVFWFLH